jgi:imidazolonepropionase-like amidohydrolase
MSSMLIKNGTLIDGTGSNPLPDAAVLIEDNKLKEIGPADKISRSEEELTEIDAQGGFILPGFIDCHVHLMAEKFDLQKSIMTPFSYHFYEAIEYFRRTVMAGVTSVRDAGGMDLGTKTAIENGLVLGPR